MVFVYAHNLCDFKLYKLLDVKLISSQGKSLSAGIL